MRLLILIMVLCLVGVPSSSAKITQESYQNAEKLCDQGKFDEAIAVLKASLDQDPDQAPVYNLLGTIYLRQNESIPSAIGSFEQAIRIDPEYAEVYFNLASIYAGPVNRPDLAAEYFKKTLEVDPKYTKAYFGLGWFTLTTREEPLRAAEYFQKVIDIYPDFVEAYYGLGLSYIQMGKAPMALQSVSQIRALGREDLAAYLESVLRGGKVSEMVQEEGGGNGPGSEDTPSELRATPRKTPRVLPAKRAAGAFAKKTKTPKSVPIEEPSENSNPFQLT